MENPQKRCPRCEQTKATDEFNKCSRYNDGLQTVCRACQREQYQAGKPRQLENQRARYVANVDQKRAEARAYGRAHKTERAAYGKEYSKRNRERINAQVRARNTVKRQQALAAKLIEQQALAASLRAQSGTRAWRPVVSNK